MIPIKFEQDMHDSRSIFYRFVVTPTGKTVSAIVLKFLSGIRILLKVDQYEGFVNQSNVTDFIVSKTSRCNFSQNFKEALISTSL